MPHRNRFASLLLLFLVTFSAPAQEVTARRILNVTLNTSSPSQLAIDRGRLIWRDTDINSGMLNLKYYSGAEIILLDSNLVGLTMSIGGNHVVWNTAGQVARAFDIVHWATLQLGPSYNPDGRQPIATHNGLVAFAQTRPGAGTEIVLRRLVPGTDTLISASLWNLSPTLHHGQVAWVIADSEASSSPSDIVFFDGVTIRNISSTGSTVRNRSPVLRDGQVAWIQSGGGFPRVKLFTDDTTITLAQSLDGSTVVSGYDVSNGIAVAALTDTLTRRSTLTIYNSETGGSTILPDSNGITSLHVSGGVVSWQSGTGPGKRLHVYTIQGGLLEDVAAAENPVVDHDIIAWTLGDAVDMARFVTYTQLTTDGQNGWQQTKFKTIDSARVVWGNFANSVNMRLFAWDNGQTTSLADSSTTNDLVIANDGYVVWRRNFDSLYYYNGTSAPVKFLDTVQAENPYVAGGSIGFYGSRTTVSENIKHIWLYRIQPPSLTRLASDSGVPGNVLCYGNTACWLNGRTERLMFFNGTSTAALSDSLAMYDYSYRNGVIVWSERRNGVWQIMMHNVAGNTTSQITTSPIDKAYPLTDGKHIAWYEHPGYPFRPANIILWWYDIASGQARPVAHSDYSGLFWNWMSNGKIAWTANGNVHTFDGDVLSRLTNDDFSINSGTYLDREMLVWRRSPPPPTISNGQVFSGKLRAHAAFDASTISGRLPLVVSFTNRSWEGARTYSWDFGDGATSTERDPIHTYANIGNYTVTLTVQGPTGSSVERKYHLVRVQSNTDVQETSAQVPLQATLAHNYPNPFNPTTAIRYELSAPSFVELAIYDLLGRKVTTLVREMKQRGAYAVNWDASQFSSGVYFYMLRAGTLVQTRKLVLLR